MTVSWIVHTWQLLGVALLAIAPVPLAWGVARRAVLPQDEAVAGHRWLVMLVLEATSSCNRPPTTATGTGC